MQNKNLDKVDKKILSILSHNSSISYSDLAEEINMSRNSVYRRIKGLKEKELINEDFVNNHVVNILKLEEIGVSSLLIGLKVHPNDLNDSNNLLRELNDVLFLLESYGDFDFFLILLCDEDEKKRVSDLRKTLVNNEITVEELDLFPVSLEKLDLTYSIKNLD